MRSLLKDVSPCYTAERIDINRRLSKGFTNRRPLHQQPILDLMEDWRGWPLIREFALADTAHDDRYIPDVAANCDQKCD